MWGKLSGSLFAKSSDLLNQSFQNRKKWWGDIALGASLGPIFTTCSPTFFLILATVLPASLAQGVVYLVAYCIGLATALLLIAFLGQKILLKFNTISDPNSSFKKVLGFVFIALAILIATGLVKRIESKILDVGFLDFTKIERSITDLLSGKEDIDTGADTIEDYTGQNQDLSLGKMGATQSDQDSTNRKISSDYDSYPYKEIVNPSGFVNANAFKLGDLVGKKVILLDFMTYSCINCQRTFPYLRAWYDKYRDQGLEVIAIHTPEFAFEKNIDNVRKAAKDFGLEFPIVLDNDYATWNAYANRFWPRKYLIDINGNVVYDHIGEGEYDTTEAKIQELLQERAEKKGEYVSLNSTDVPEYGIYSRSPETYFGAWRNRNFGNGKAGVEYSDIFSLPNIIFENTFYLGGEWNIGREYVENIGAPVDLVFKFDAKEVYMVAESADEFDREVEVYLDGSMVTSVYDGNDVNSGKVMIKDSTLYHLISLPEAGKHTLRLVFKKPKTRIYTFTFG